MNGYLGKGSNDMFEILLHGFQSKTAGMLKLFRNSFHPLFNHSVRISFLNLISFYLIAEKHQQIAIDNPGNAFPNDRQCQKKAAVVLHS